LSISTIPNSRRYYKVLLKKSAYPPNKELSREEQKELIGLNTYLNELA